MDSGMISQIEKAKRYAEERDRVRFMSLEVEFEGDNSTHIVRYNNGTWQCSCRGFGQRGVCSHTMALERILSEMVSPALPAHTYMDSGMIGQIEKAKRYAEERGRIRFNRFEVEFRGDNNTHTVRYDQGAWHSTSHFFAQRGVSSHTMALERILAGMVLPALTPQPVS